MNRLLLSNSQNSENEEKASSKPYVKKKNYMRVCLSVHVQIKSFSQGKEGKRKGKKYSCETADKIVSKFSYVVSYTV